MEALSITYSEGFRLPRSITLRSQRNPLKEKYFCQVTSTSLDSHNTQQECLNSKLVRFSTCCALLRLVSLGASIQPWQPGPQNNNANVFHSLVSCASTLTSMMANSVLPVCLSKSVQATFSILSYHGSVDNATYDFTQVDTYMTVLIVTVL